VTKLAFHLQGMNAARRCVQDTMADSKHPADRSSVIPIDGAQYQAQQEQVCYPVTIPRNCTRFIATTGPLRVS
jgi:hypothetical protein